MAFDVIRPSFAEVLAPPIQELVHTRTHKAVHRRAVKLGSVPNFEVAE